jgi:hypothetical protein
MTTNNTEALRTGNTIEFEYTNYRGEVATRRAVVVEFAYGSTTHHPEPQMFLMGFDTGKKAVRAFATKDMRDVRHAR